MRIRGARFYRYSLPLTRPLTLRDKTITQRDGIIVGVESDTGAIGYGDIAPLPGFSRETLPEALAAARSCLDSIKQRANVAGPTPPALREREPFPASVRFGMECALLNMGARAQGIPATKYYTDSPQTRVPISALLVGNAEAVVPAARKAVESGYTTLKLKVGRTSVKEDMDAVRAIRSAVSQDVSIRVDANRAWTFEDAARFCHAAAESNVSFVEEPLSEADRLSELARISPVPIAIDETLQEVGWSQIYAWREDDLLEPGAPLPSDASPQLRALLAARVWVVKPTLVGCSLNWLAALLTGRRRIDADLVLSSSFESGLGLAALGMLGSCGGKSLRAVGLDTESWLERDVLSRPLPIRKGQLDTSELHLVSSYLDTAHLEELKDG